MKPDSDRWRVIFSSERQDWETPPELFELLNCEFGFTVDAAATPENAKCKRYYTKEQDGLTQDWSREVVWLNPPYGRPIAKWLRKTVASVQAGATVVALLPVRADVGWWHDYVLAHAAEIRYIRGRVRFVGGRYSATFASAVVIFLPPVSRHRHGQARPLPTPDQEHM